MTDPITLGEFASVAVPATLSAFGLGQAKKASDEAYAAAETAENRQFVQDHKVREMDFARLRADRQHLIEGIRLQAIHDQRIAA